MRRRLLIAATVAVVAGLLALLAWPLAGNRLASDRVRDRIVAALTEATGGVVSVEEVRIHPLSAEVAISGLRLEAGRGALETLRLDEGRASVRLLDLLFGRVRLTEIDARGVLLGLDTTADTAAPPRDRDLTAISRLERVRLRDGRLVIDGETVPFSLDVENVAITAEPRGPGRTGSRGRLETGPARLELGALPPQSFERATARFNWEPPRIDVTDFRLTGPSATLEGSVRVGLTRRGAIVRGSASGRLVPDLVLPEDVPPARGRVRVWALFGAAVPGEWFVRGDLAGDGPLDWQGLRWLDAAARFELGPSRFGLTDLTARTPRGSRVHALGVSVQDGHVALEGHGDVAVIDALDRAGLDRGLASGTARLSLSAAAEIGDASALSWSIAGDLAAETSDRAGLVGRLDADGGPAGTGVRYAGRWGGASVRLEAGWDGALPGGPWRLETDVAAPSGGAARALLRRVTDQARTAGATVDPGLLPDPSGGLEARVSARGSGAAVESGTLLARVEGPLFGGRGFERLSLRAELAEEGGWSARGRLLAGDGRGLTASVTGLGAAVRSFRGTVDGLRWSDLAALVPAAPAALPYGADPTIDAAGFGGVVNGVPRVHGVVSATDRVFARQGGPPERLSAAGSLRGRTLDVAWSRFRGAGVDASFAGTVELPEGEVGPAVTGTVSAEADLAALHPALSPEPLAGTLRADGRIAWPGQGALPSLEGALAWHGVFVRGLRLPDATARVRPGGGGTVLSARGAGLSLELAARAENGAPWIDGRLAWNGIEALELGELIANRPVELALAIFTDGVLAFEGPLREPDAWTGEGTVERFEVDGPSVHGELAEPVPIRLEAGGRIRLARGAPLAVATIEGGALEVFGHVDVLGEGAGALALTGRGGLDLRLLEVFDPDLVASGRVDAAVEIGGTLADPSFSGTLDVTRGRLRFLTLLEVVDGLEARLALRGDRIEIADARCRVGGGDVTLSGAVTLDAWVPGRLDLALTARDVALSVPRDIWGRYDADLALVGTAEEPEIRGTIRVLAGRYSRPFGFGSLFTDRVRLVDPGLGLASRLSRIGYRLRIIADESFLVRNDMARLEASVRFDVSGTVGRPLVSGAISLIEGGRIQFRGIEYEVLSGQVILDDLYVDPVRLRLRAVTDIRGYRVRLDIDASTERVQYELSSTPALSEADILSLLITGETVAEGGGSGLIGPDVATAYFGSELGELLLAGTARRLLGVTIFQLAPSRVGPDARPTARLTIGRRIDDRTLALYSRDLSAEARDLYRLERELSRKLRLSLSRESLGGVGVDLRFLTRFGEASEQLPAGAPPARPPLGGVEITGLPAGVDAPRARRLGLRRGSPLRRADIIEARESLARELVEGGFLEARVSAETEARGDRIVLRLVAEPGPSWTVEYVGPSRATRLARETLAELWALTGFRPELLRESERVLAEAFAEEGYSTALIEIGRPDPGAERLVVSVDPGPRVVVAEVNFEGVSAIPERDVRAQVLSRPSPGITLGGGTVFRPRLLREDVAAVRALYESRGWLEARVDTRQRYGRDGERVVITFIVDEGPRTRVGSVRVEGDWPDELGPATPRIALEPGAVFLPDELESARRALARALDDAGWYDATVFAVPVIEDSVVDVTFRVAPGPRAAIEAVRIVGLERTRERVVRRALALEAGEPLSQQAMKETERALFALGLFRDVDVVHAPAGDDPARRVVSIVLDEIPPVSLLGSIGYDTEEKLRVSGALSHDNLGGTGRAGSIQGFVSDRRGGVRATLEEPNLARRRLEGLLTVGWVAQEREGFRTESVEAGLQIGTRTDRQKRWQLRYLLEDTRFTEVTLDPDALRDVLLSERGRLDPIRLGSLRGSFTIDRRDDPFLPGRGWVVRTDAGLWARPLASQAEFTRLNAQAAGYQPLGEKLTLVGAVRTGFAWPRADTPRVPLSERFFAGGADTLRGFERDKLGPLDGPGGEPLGGESLFIVNLEARYRIWKQFEIAPFIDFGNVWIDAGGFDPGDLRETWGVSLRLRTAVGPLRLGYGRKFDVLPGESSGEIFISIGEQF